MSALAQGWGTNIAIGKSLETIVNMLFRTRHHLENGNITEPICQRRILRLQKVWRENLAEGSRICVMPRYRNRCTLFLQHYGMCWTFLTNQAIPLSNNEAERSLRSNVMWRKGSYGLWSQRGELFRQRILTIVESCCKLGLIL